MNTPGQQEGTTAEYGIEVMGAPDIEVKDERPHRIVSAVLRTELFKEQLREATLGIGTEGAGNEEALYALALATERPWAAHETVEQIKKHKGFIPAPAALLERVTTLVREVGASKEFADMEADSTRQIKAEIEKRKRELSSMKEQVARAIAYFKPARRTTLVKRITIIASDPLWPENSGRAFPYGEELVLIVSSLDNFGHEFLHEVINPIIDKLDGALSESQKTLLAHKASQKLREEYGEYYYSLLCETLIRTYNDYLKKGKRPPTREEFVAKAQRASIADFDLSYRNSQGFKSRCDKLGIRNAEQYGLKSGEYYDTFEKSELQENIVSLYDEYSTLQGQEGVNFERFLLDNYQRLLAVGK